MKVYVYNKKSLVFSHELTISAELLERNLNDKYDFTLSPPPDHKSVWRWVDDKWLADEIDIEEVQNSVWANIKERRSLELTKGVTVQSVDKVFQTDNDSIIQYTNIAGMIALDNYIPIQWKTMDNSWITLTVELFKELQAAISTKTNTNFQVAELHKANMMLSSNPQDYDYSTGWV